MPLVSKATKSSFERSKRYSIFRRSKRRKKPFQYTYKAIHHRMWSNYLGKNAVLIFQLIGAPLLLICILAFTGGLYFHLGIAIVVYIYTNVCSTFFRDRFHSDILRVLPWDLPVYKRTFSKWTMYGASILSIPVLIYGILNWTVWAPVKWLLYGFVYIYMYHLKMDKAITILSKQMLTFDLGEGIGLLFLVSIVVSHF